MPANVEESCQWLLNNRASDCWRIMPVTVEESCQWLLKNCASDCWRFMPATIEWSCQWMLSNRSSNCWRIIGWEERHPLHPCHILPSIILECLWQTMKTLVTVSWKPFQYIWTYIYVVYVRLSIFIPVFASNFVNGTWWFYKVKCGKGKSRVIKFTPKICHQLAKLPFLAPFIGDNRQSYPFSLWCGKEILEQYFFL